MPRQVSHIALLGGLDLVSSPLTIEPGRLWSGFNFEPVEAGYRRMLGYERVDGRPAPSDADYWMLGRTLPDGHQAAELESTVTGATSGATGYLFAVQDEDYVLSEVTGVFESGEVLTSGGNMVGVVSGVGRRFGAIRIPDDLDFRAGAAAHRRAAIEAVPGSGAVRGVWVYKGAIYAVRDNADGTAGALWRATSAGWTVVPAVNTYEISMDAGIRVPDVGARIRGQTSRAEGVITAVDLDGTFDGNAGGSAVITITRSNMTAWQNDEKLEQNISSIWVAIGSVDGTLVTRGYSFPAGGTYRFVNHNFGGQADTQIMVGVQGVDRGFTYNGTAFENLDTGHADDRPNHVAVHRNRLMLAYRGGSLILSSVGEPTNFDGQDGAAEIACGQDVNGLLEGVGIGNTLIVGEDRIQVLYGNSAEDFELADHSDRQTGGVEGTVQFVGSPVYMDNRGVRTLDTTEAYGNFVIGTMTSAVQPWIDRQRAERNPAVGSLRVRSSDQYRVFFRSGIGLVVYVGRGRPELAFFDYGSDEEGVKVFPTCTVSVEDSDRIERVYFGAPNGFVYEADRGTSHDGRSINAYARLPLNHVGAPVQQKRFFGADVHLDVRGQVTLGLSALYEDGANPEQLLDDAAIHGGGGFWDEAIFDEFIWDAPLNGYHKYDLTGIGRNVSMLLLHRSDREISFTINGISLHWAHRRAER